MNTDFKKIPHGWRLSTVGSECKICNNLREPLSEEERATMQGTYPYYGPTKAVDYLDRFRVEGTYALIGEDGDHFLKYNYQDMTQLVSGRFNVNNHAHLVQGGSECSTEWFYTFFRHRSIAPFLTRQGAGRYKLNKAALERMPFLIPPKAEQDIIHSAITRWDYYINLIERLLTAKQERRTWLMQQLLTGKRRLPGFAGEWRKIHIGDILKEVKRPVKWDDNHLYKLISVRRRSEGLFQREHLYGSQIKTKKMNLAKAGDFLISKMQIVHGASGLVTDEFDGMHISDSYIALRSSIPKIFDINFFNWLSKLPLMYQHALFSSYGVHIEKMTFNLTDYLARNIKIPPSIDEQQAIVKILITADREIDLLRSQLEALREQKKGLMQQLLTGKVRVKV